MAGLTRPRPDLAAHEQAIRTPFAALVRDLTALLGKKLTAYIAGVKDVRAVDRWIAGAEPYGRVEARLRLAFQIAQFLTLVDSPAVVQAWFLGLNPELDDRAPIRLLREGDPEREGREVLAAARAFAAGG